MNKTRREQLRQFADDLGENVGALEEALDAYVDAEDTDDRQVADDDAEDALSDMVATLEANQERLNIEIRRLS